MAVNRRIYFFGATDVQLNAWLALANEDLAAGKVISTWSAGDTSASHTVAAQSNTRKRIEMLLNDLGIPESERDEMDPHDCLPVKMTRPRYV